MNPAVLAHLYEAVVAEGMAAPFAADRGPVLQSIVRTWQAKMPKRLPLDAALQKRLSAPCADAGNFIQHRSRAFLSALCAVTDDREAVRFITDLLDEVQAEMRRRELQRARLELDDPLGQPISVCVGCDGRIRAARD